MASLLVRNATLVRTDGLQPASDVYIEGGRIARIGRDLPARGAGVFDVDGRLVSPGFIDLHIHGAAGAMCEQGEPDAVARISAMLVQFGVTGFLPTVATLGQQQLQNAVEGIASTAGGEPGAQILGIHLEGPYLSPIRAGAQAVPWMREPSVEEVDDLQSRSGGLIRLITVAPELEGAVPFIAAVRGRGVTVAVGHSNATAEEMLLGIEAGASHVTHLFNAMRELHHREPGVIGVGLTEDSVSVELICDGHHLSPRIVNLALRCKPAGKAVLVSDAVGALGMPDGDYEMFGVTCTISDGAVRLRHGRNLAGSCLSLDRAVRNVRRWLPDLSLPRLLASASTSAAEVVGVTDTGRIDEGLYADLVILEEDLNVAATICRGALVWRRPAWQVP